MSDETVYDPTHLADPHAPPFVPAPEWTTGEHFSETMLAPGVRATVSMVHGSSPGRWRVQVVRDGRHVLFDTSLMRKRDQPRSMESAKSWAFSFFKTHVPEGRRRAPDPAP